MNSLQTFPLELTRLFLFLAYLIGFFLILQFAFVFFGLSDLLLGLDSWQRLGFFFVIQWTLFWASLSMCFWRQVPLFFRFLLKERVNARALLFAPVYFCVFLLMQYIFIFIQSLGDFSVFGPQDPLLDTWDFSNFGLVTVFFMLVILGPFFEEVFFRGVFFEALRSRFNFWISACASSIFFAVLHFQIETIVPIFLLGMILAYVYEKYRSILLVFAIHAMNNALQLLFLLS